MAHSKDSSGLVRAPVFEKHIADLQKSEAAILKQRRQAKEEEEALRKRNGNNNNGKKGGRDSDPAP